MRPPARTRHDALSHGHGHGHGPRNRRVPLTLTSPVVALLLTAVFVVVSGCRSQHAAAGDQEPQWYDYEVVNAFPHDPRAFTQGLLFRDGYFFESTGLYGESDLRRVRPETGEVLQLRSLPAHFFGEGLTDFGNRLIQVTWRENTGLVYDIDTFSLLGTFTYLGEGWGLTNDGTHLIMSDGTPELRFLDPYTFEEQHRVTVTQAGEPVENINELAMIDGRIYANIWLMDEIVIIDPLTGHVTGRADMRGLLPPRERERVDVLNGIAHDAEQDRLFVTGKLWPQLFEIRLVPRP
jgi:glutaminyl-peptide cyclotransferase